MPEKKNPTSRPHLPHRFRLPRTRLLLLLAALLIVAAYAWLLAPSSLLRPGDFSSYTGAVATRPAPATQKPESEPGLSHALPYDKRIANGLQQAFRQWLTLFAPTGYPSDISVTALPLSNDHYELTYAIQGEAAATRHRVRLSVKGEDITDNLEQALVVLREFTQSHPSRIAMRGGKPSDAALATVRAFVDQFTVQGLLAALEFVEQAVAAQREPPQLLLAASETFAWWAYFKAANQDDDLGDLLATYAVSTYLLGRLYSDSDTDAHYHTGLLLLALDYPSAATTVLAKTGASHALDAAVLSAHVRRDADRLLDLAEDRAVNRRLIAYLIARTHNDAGERKAADLILTRLLREDPDFLLAQEYAVATAGFALRKAHARSHLISVLGKHLEIIAAYWDPSQIAPLADSTRQAYSATTLDDVLQTWLTIHGRLLQPPTGLKRQGALFDGGLLRRFLKHDMFNALLAWYEFEWGSLGRLDATEKIPAIITAAYPDSSLGHALQLRRLMVLEDWRAIFSHINQLDSAKANRYLLRTMIDALSRWQGDWADYARALQALDHYRNAENPNARGLEYLCYQYEGLLHRPFAIDFLAAALIVDPYNPSLYREAGNHAMGYSAFQQGEGAASHVYGFRVALGDWHREHKRTDQAITHYEAAIERGPIEYEGYAKLGGLYHSVKQDDKAVAAWQAYLVHDRDSLDAVDIKGYVAAAYLRQNRAQQAYEILAEAKRSYKNGALMDFAWAAEKTGRRAEAEEYFQRAAKRYPTTVAPVELAKHYLRQKDEAAAIEVLRHYRSFNKDAYYFDSLIAFFAERQQPERLVDIAEAVQIHNPDPWWKHALASAYRRKGYAAIAAELYGQEMLGLDRADLGPVHHSAAGYIAAMQDMGGTDTAQLLKDILPAYALSARNLESLAAIMMGDGHFDAAFALSAAWYEAAPDRRVTALLMMAVAWRLGSQAPEHKREIVQRLQSQVVRKWYTELIGMLLTDVDEQTVRRLAVDVNKRCELYTYLGMIAWREGRIDQAWKNILASLDTLAAGNVEYYYAHLLAQELSDTGR